MSTSARVIVGRMRCRPRSASRSSGEAYVAPGNGGPGDRQGVQVDPEDEDEDQPDPEGRQAPEHERRDHRGPVHPRAAAGRRQDAEADAEDDDQQGRGAQEDERVDDPLGEDLDHRPVIGRRRPELTGRDAAEVDQVLADDRLVETVDLAQALDRLRTQVAGTRLEPDRVAGQDPEQDEVEGRDCEEREPEDGQLAEQVGRPEHPASRPSRVAHGARPTWPGRRGGSCRG